ncbi:hypothetical protein JOM56_007955 [Amanita muscaria]
MKKPMKASCPALVLEADPGCSRPNTWKLWSIEECQIACCATSSSYGHEGLTAIVLYDQDAAEDNEVSFREGDRVTAASGDWWEGTLLHGRRGLFPE